MLSSCPFCQMHIPFMELEWHVNSHLVEDECTRDAQLAQQLALDPPSPRPLNPESGTSSFKALSPEYSERTDEEKISCLLGVQTRSTFHQIDGGLMTLLRRCLESERGNFVSVISAHVDHYQTIKSEDAGFGCGWRNIQMLSSHLLMQRQESRDVMFGGSGFVPDIPSLQRWLEIAWERGFDRVGSQSFNHNIYGSRKWIGTTECATLLRSFGLRANVVDFDALSCAVKKQEMQGNSRQNGVKGKVKHVYGPMDKFLYKKRCNDFNVTPSCMNSQEECSDLANLTKGRSNLSNNDSPNDHNGKINSHQILVDWIWSYFNFKDSCGLDDGQRTRISRKTPLYFQHQGHSRTIVGIQVQKGMRGSPDRYSLLILDPGHRTSDLERSLKTGYGWQKMIKRGVHTLRKPQYQLCYVDTGIACEEEIEKLKNIESILVTS